jgi:hypothetical protein
MDIKKTNMKLLLGKIRMYLNAQRETMKKDKKFIEAEKALAQLEKVFAEKVGDLVICRKNQPML